MQRAVNPQTGEVLFLVNNQWVPPSSTAKNPQTGQTAYLVNNEWQIVDPIKKPEEPGFLERVTGFTPGQLAEAAVPEFDLVKRGVASAIQGIAGAPAGTEAALRGVGRRIATGEVGEDLELYQLGKRLFGSEPTQKDIQEAKELPAPNISRTEYDLKDELIRQTIMDTQDDVDDIKETLDKIDSRLYEMQTKNGL